jgi:hypothetical protein
MLWIAGLIVVDRPEAPTAYSARCAHSTEPGPVFPAEVAVGASWVCHRVLAFLFTQQRPTPTLRRAAFFSLLILALPD